ncbi:hypothetical protein [Rhodanobacter soli]|nr:hypothetical protein [Rhodanobacter denitrificans]
MNYDYYSEARKLAALIQPFSDESAKKVLSALTDGATATEILMMLRWHIQSFLEEQIGSDESRSLARALIGKIDAAIGPS